MVLTYDGAQVSRLVSTIRPGRWLRPVLALPLLALLVLGCALPPLRRPIRRTTIATGLTAPRQLTLAPDGSVYVAEVGDSSTGGSLARIAPDRIEVVATGLPYATYVGDEEVGTSGLALRRGEPYVVQGEGGGVLRSQLLRVPLGQGTAEPIAGRFCACPPREPRS